jgi:hypothetical protein
VVAPYPDSHLSTYAYVAARYRYNLFSGITKWRKGSYSMREPHYADIDPTSCKRFVERRKREAAEQYELFVAKLIGKIGHVVKAELEGNHVWAESYLTVTKLDGTTECWKTQQITNVSKLGKYFNQWPTPEWEAGYSIDAAHDAFSAGWTVDQYITAVIANRRSLSLSV